MSSGARAWCAVLAGSLVAVACSPKRVREPGQPPMISFPRARADTPRAGEPMPADEPPPPRPEGSRDVRVALATAAQGAVLSGTGAFRLYDARNSEIVRARAPDAWTIERRGRRLRAVRQGTSTSWSDGMITLRTDRDDELGVFAGQRFRGVLRVVATDTGIVIVNVLPVEWYLRGVVPLEIGTRSANEEAAVEAQAIAARSYTVVRLAATNASAARNANYDLLSSVADQVYGGVDAERSFSNEAVARTVGLVIKYKGRVVNAPYHSTCGGETAEPDEVWKAGDEPYLKRVSDRIPGTGDRYYCDASPRFSWTRTLSASQLDAAVRAYLANYAAVPSGGAGHVREATIESRTASGRVAQLMITADRGTFTLRGNDIRYVLRQPGGEILNSTYFSLEPEPRRGSLDKLVVNGKGYGHGIGMCQWGAIGRARAGQSARSILATYYPGTTVGSM
ncbi:MAG TPA: SpoIID/LytB domain-containing protein [Gemmatimonadaceae bacterium]